MDNRGKVWTFEDDQRIMEHPERPNTHFSQLMGRSENAIRFRRTHLAAKLHQQQPHTPLHECVALMGGDLPQAQQLLEQWRLKQDSLSNFFESRKRRLAEPGGAGAAADGWASKSEREQIALVCRAIREEEGRLATLWRDPDLAACLVQHFAGFDAFARHVQACQARE